MPKLDGLRSVLEFTAGLQPKVAGQIARKVLALGDNPKPADSQELAGHVGLRRVDIGEYRIVYAYMDGDDLVEVLLIGKRNDDDVYKRLRRLTGR